MLPKLSGNYETNFLSLLKIEKGFEKWVTLPKKPGFYSALAFGLLLHIYPTYIELTNFMDRSFKPRIEPILAIEQRFTCTFQDFRYMNSDYWLELSKACRLQCANVFRQPPVKPQSQSRIEQNELIDFADVDSYRRIASYFQACVIIYENTENGVKTMTFCSQEIGAVSFIVCLAVEDEEISVLIHRDFKPIELTSDAFPYYIRVVRQHDPGKIIHTLANMVNDLVDIARAGVQPFDAPLQTNFDNLREKVKILQLDEILGGVLNFEELHSLLQSQDAQPRPAHTCVTCEHYPEAGLLFEDHGHSFHRQCLEECLLSQVDNGASDLRCPIQGCQQIFLESLIHQFSKVETRLMQTRPCSITQSLPAGSQPCKACQDISIPNGTVELAHGCKLCLDCARNSYAPEQCSKCDNRLTPADFAVLKKVL